VLSNQYKPFAPANSHRWFEESASKLGAEHFDKKYGSGAPGYQKNNPNYFNKKNFNVNTQKNTKNSTLTTKCLRNTAIFLFL